MLIKRTALKKIEVMGGDVWRGLKKNEADFKGFGEVYFSWIDYGFTKGWKRHLEMTMNLMVPVGLVEFSFRNADGCYLEKFKSGADDFERISIEPGVWFAFKGLQDPSSLILNLSNILHDEHEVERLGLEEMTF